MESGYWSKLLRLIFPRQVETIQTTALLKSARIVRGVLETFGHSDSSEKSSAYAGVKIIIIIIQSSKSFKLEVKNSKWYQPKTVVCFSI